MAALVTFLNQQLENQRHTANALKALAASMPLETAAWLTGIADGLQTDVEAKRLLLELHPYAGLLSAPESCEPCVVVPGPCPTLRLLALPYAGHPDYRDEWKPA